MSARIEALEVRRLLAAAAVTHIYELNNSFADSLGGPAAVGVNGSLNSTGFTFNEGGGLSISSAVNPNEYSIELKYKFTAATGSVWRRVISYKNLTDDTGLYEVGTSLDFYNITGAAGPIPNGTVKSVIITREASTKLVKIYLNGSQILSFTDSAGVATFTSANNILQLFRDNTSNGALGEQDPGFVDRVRIYSGVLTAAQVTSLQNGGAPPGLSSILFANGVLTVNGTSAADTITVTPSGSNLVAKIGSATKTVATSQVTKIAVNGNDGNDSITIAAGVTKPTTLLGGNGNDSITGGGGADVIDGGLGADVVKGGGGIDTADYSTRTSPLFIFLDDHANDGQAGERDNVASDVEVVLGGSANDVIYGSAANNTLKGNGGADYLFGGAGNDSLDGGAGDDELAGGDGNDVLVGGAGSDQLFGDAGNDTLLARSSPADKDFADGGAGTDSGQKDSLDSFTAIETILA